MFLTFAWDNDKINTLKVIFMIKWIISISIFILMPYLSENHSWQLVFLYLYTPYFISRLLSCKWSWIIFSSWPFSNCNSYAFVFRSLLYSSVAPVPIASIVNSYNRENSSIPFSSYPRLLNSALIVEASGDWGLLSIENMIILKAY